MPKFALLFFAAGLLIQIQSISAQDVAAEDARRIAEQSMMFGEGSAPVAPPAGVDTWAIVRMILVLVLAAAAIYGVVFLFKRASKQTPSNDPFLKILASAHLGSNRYVHVVAVGTKTWLLGSCDGGVSPIGEINDPDIINAMLLEDSRKTAESVQGRFPDFMSLLRRAGVSAKINTPGADEIRKRRERLKGL
ncbi:MAG: flagellar biosynthetic protein FliO [Treponema sp.]|nr:flagellar biosynthetic protein FliO [Treponema sp.]